MFWPLAIITTGALLGICVILTPFIHFDLTFVMVPLTAIWAGIDSRKLELKRYKTSFPANPVAIGCCVLLLWIIVFPWYLIVRGRVLSGKQPLKEAPPGFPVEQAAAPAEPQEPIQP